MLTSTILLSLLGLVSAVAADNTTHYEFLIKNYNFLYATEGGGSTLSFDLSAPKSGDFPPVHASCYRASSEAGYVECDGVPKDAGKVSKQVYIKYKVHQGKRLKLFIDYEVQKPPSYVFNAYGNKTIHDFAGTKAPFYVVVSRETAIG